eukprot:SAG22_NODE_786_length_7246_cov_3.133762_3_plen_148_part_00
MAHSRNIFCQKEGYLTHNQISELANVTFLNPREIKNIEMLWLFIREKCQNLDIEYERKHGEPPPPEHKQEHMKLRKRHKKGDGVRRLCRSRPPPRDTRKAEPARACMAYGAAAAAISGLKYRALLSTDLLAAQRRLGNADNPSALDR